MDYMQVTSKEATSDEGRWTSIAKLIKREQSRVLQWVQRRLMNKSAIKDIVLVIDSTRIPKIQKLLQESYQPQREEVD